ncbi:hypothetical protein BGX28_010266 [Mortierella sp. GBA30]|nr:hypothetical protein BGX28_010266 [Mortierella sp. GBA30]
MFLVYGVLAGDAEAEKDEGRQGARTLERQPTISFLAYPLVDYDAFLEQTLLNSRAIERLQHDAEEDEAASLSEKISERIVFEDAVVDSIMNGGDDGDESGYGSEKAAVDMNLDEDSHSTGAGKPIGVSSSSGVKVIKKGIGRLKSPSRAAQQPLDVTTESLRRKLLGPASVRKSLGSKLDSSSFASMHVGLKSPSRRKSAGGTLFSRSNVLPGSGQNDDIPDLMTMLKLKKKQSSERSRKQEDDSSFSSSQPITSSSKERASLARSVTEDNLGSSRSSTNPFLDTLKSLQNEHCSEQADVREPAFESPVAEAPSPFVASTQARSRPVTLPSSLSNLGGTSSSSSSKSIEAQNKATIKGLIKSVLRKINIGSDHEDFEACAGVLYEGVKVAMRRDIATKRYHLEELERLMDRHAALL